MAKTIYRMFLNFLVAVSLLIITGEYDGNRIDIIETLEKQSYDWRLRYADPVKNPNITIVDIDRDTLRKYGNWPLNRNLFAELNQQLSDKYQAQIIAYALPFSQPDDTALELLIDIEKQLEDVDDFTLRYRLRNLRDHYNYDQHVIETIENKTIVLGYSFDETGRVDGILPPPIEFVDAKKNPISKSYIKSLARNWAFYNGYSGSIPEYLRAAQNNAGHINHNIDQDGIVRHSPYFINHSNSYYPSLPLAVYQQIVKEKDIGASIIPATWPLGAAIEIIRLGEYSIPTDRYGKMYIRYLGSGGRNVNFEDNPDATFRYVSFTDVLEGIVPEEHLRGKIVFVGSSSEQLRLLYPTPVNPAMPGVEILATQLANLMADTLLKRSNAILTNEIVILLVISGVLSVLFALLSPVISLLLLFGSIAAYAQFTFHQWTVYHEIWALLPMLVTLVGIFIFNTIIGFIIEWRTSRRLQSTFGQYVPPEFAKRIGTSSKKINLEGESRELSVLFSDVRNFTAISESLSPQELTLMMNRMFTVLSEAIHQYGGTVDKYIGDAIMAFWNAPLHDEKHAQNSVLAAMEMQTAMQTLNEELKKKGFDKPLNLGIGICTGDANVGNMGSTLRMTYTAIGDTVNLASRTESLTKYYHCPVLVTETTYAQCTKDIVFRPVDLVRVKGRQQPALLYQPVGKEQLLQPGTKDQLEKFENIRQLYVKGDFNAAKTAMESYQQMAPEDGLAKIYEERIAFLLKNPPQEKWNGIMTHEQK